MHALIQSVGSAVLAIGVGVVPAAPADAALPRLDRGGADRGVTPVTADRDPTGRGRSDGAGKGADEKTGAGEAAHRLPETRIHPSLRDAFDNVGITDDRAPGAGDLDGAGRSFRAADLAAAGWRRGATITIGGTDFTWPDVRPGRPDNVVANGQTIRVRGRGRALSLLVTGTGGAGTQREAGPDAADAGRGAVTGRGTIIYADGTRRSYTVTAPDWERGPSSVKAVRLPRRNTPDGSEQVAVRIYPVTVPLDPDKPVRAVTLPVTGPLPGPAIHVFALGVRPTGWTATWATSTSGLWEVGPWVEQTRRMVVHTSVGGDRARIRLENTFADAPLTIGGATIAVQADGATAAERPVRVTFRGRAATTIPAGAQAISDPVRFDVPAGRNLLVNLHLPGPVAAAPVHSLETQTSYATAGGAGDHTGDTDGDAFVESHGYWSILTGVDVSEGPGTLVALGDSITDGYASTMDANERWPDHLAARLRAQAAIPRYGVANAGISGNKVVTDRFTGEGPSTDSRGVSARNRFDRDVLAQPDARTVIVLEGINDLRGDTTAAEVIAGLREIATGAHAHGLRVLAGTLTPCTGWPDCTAEVEKKRQEVNAYLRAQVREGASAARPDRFDAILDFDAVVRDPADPSRFRPEYDSGDHLHPGDAGYRAMAASIDLRLLVGGAARDT